MALPPLATVDDLGDWLGQTIEEAVDVARAEAVLRAASALVRAVAGRAWVDDSQALLDVPDDVATIVVQVAARAWRNPDGWTQTTVGDVSVGYGRDAAAGGVYLLDSERRVLSRFTASTTRKLWTLATTRSDTDLPDVYLDVVGSEPIPFLPADS